ncbi:MAG: hypothetical protein E7255_04235 [Lachnospiraceae bacterium]|jgi:hypothetical protein|nr:hypothetical protein [Lachnospiraceae bacterium]
MKLKNQQQIPASFIPAEKPSSGYSCERVRLEEPYRPFVFQRHSFYYLQSWIFFNQGCEFIKVPSFSLNAVYCFTYTIRFPDFIFYLAWKIDITGRKILRFILHNPLMLLAASWFTGFILMMINRSMFLYFFRDSGRILFLSGK